MALIPMFPEGMSKTKERKREVITIMRVWVSWVFNGRTRKAGLTVHGGSGPYLPSVSVHGTWDSF